MNLPLENGEGLQVLHYPTGAGSEPHFDYLQPTNAANRESIARSGQRVSTLVTYLNDVPAGGQTRVSRRSAGRRRRCAATRSTSSTATTTARVDAAFAARQRAGDAGREVGRDEVDAPAALRVRRAAKG